MGTSTSWEQVDAKLRRLAVGIADVPNTQVAASVAIVKTNVGALMPNMLRGVGKNGAPLSIAVNAGTFEGDPKALVFVEGPAQLVENDTRAHLIIPSGARGLGAGRGSKAKNAASLLGAGPRLSGLSIGFGRGAVLKGPGKRGFAAYAKHPGTKGKHPWAKGTAASVAEIDKVFDKPATAVLHAIF